MREDLRHRGVLVWKLGIFQGRLRAPCFSYLCVQAVSLRTKVRGCSWDIAQVQISRREWSNWKSEKLHKVKLKNIRLKRINSIKIRIIMTMNKAKKCHQNFKDQFTHLETVCSILIWSVMCCKVFIASRGLFVVFTDFSA